MSMLLSHGGILIFGQRGIELLTVVMESLLFQTANASDSLPFVSMTKACCSIAIRRFLCQFMRETADRFEPVGHLPVVVRSCESAVSHLSGASIRDRFMATA
jgi:hypothetical protein